MKQLREEKNLLRQKDNLLIDQVKEEMKSPLAKRQKIGIVWDPVG